MTFKFEQAQRSDTKLLIGLYGQSGSGKTYSGLMLGRGLVGPNGKLGMVDTESGRGALYADVIPGGYLRTDLSDPFTPERYIQAIEDAERLGIECLVIDSASHEWEGIGGVLEQAGAIEQATGRAGLHCWNKPKAGHLKLQLKLQRANMHIICLLRAKRKSRQGKDEKGKTVIVKDEFASPKQDPDFIFDMMVHAEILPDHKLRVTKISSPTLVDHFVSGQMISVEMGARLAEWAKGADGGTKATDWPSFTKLSDFATWSATFLQTATADTATAWEAKFRTYLGKLVNSSNAQAQKSGADLMAAYSKIIAPPDIEDGFSSPAEAPPGEEQVAA